MRARRGGRNQHRIFSQRTPSPRKTESKTATGTVADSKTNVPSPPVGKRPAQKNQPIPPPRPPLQTPPTGQNNNPSPRERRKREARQQRRNAGPITGSQPQYEYKQGEFPEKTRRGRENPPTYGECPWNNVSPTMKAVLTKYEQPTKEEVSVLCGATVFLFTFFSTIFSPFLFCSQKKTFHLSPFTIHRSPFTIHRLMFFHRVGSMQRIKINKKSTVRMPNGTKFKAALGGLVPGSEHDYGRGKQVRWSQSNDAPQWMVNQNKDQGALIEPKDKEFEHGWQTGYHRLGMTGIVGDNTVSGEGPSWMVDAMDRYNPELVLHRNKEFKQGPAAVVDSATGQPIEDGTVSGDMPLFVTTVTARNSAAAVRPQPKLNWYNKKITSAEASGKRHPSHVCQKDSWTYSLGGVRSCVDYGNGIQITDSSVSGDAPTWMEELSMRTDPDNVIRRSNNDLDFQNKTFKPEIEKTEGFGGQAWTDSTVSGDCPSWMTEQNARIDPRIVREQPKHKRPWRQKNAPTSIRPFPKQSKANIRNPKGRTKTKKRFGDGRNVRKLPNKPGLHKPKVTRAPEGPVNMRNVAGGSGMGTSTGRYKFA
jgi:hypothetical protein